MCLYQNTLSLFTFIKTCNAHYCLYRIILDSYKKKPAILFIFIKTIFFLKCRLVGSCSFSQAKIFPNHSCLHLISTCIFYSKTRCMRRFTAAFTKQKVEIHKKWCDYWNRPKYWSSSGGPCRPRLPYPAEEQKHWTDWCNRHCRSHRNSQLFSCCYGTA